MKIKELEAKIAELQRELAELKNPKTTYGDLVAGDTFYFRGHEFTKLKDGRAIINDYNEDFMNCIFDNVDNRYKASLIRHFINNKLYDLLGFETGDWEPFSGCELLSKEEYEENRDLIKSFDTAWWLRSGYPSYSCDAYYVNPSGEYDYSNVHRSNGARPVFKFSRAIKVQVVNEHKD